MILGRVERYTVVQQPNAVVIKMGQGGNSLRFTSVALAVLAVSWWFGPFGPRPSALEGPFFWLWSGLWTFFLLIGLVGACYREDWSIGAHEVVVRKSFGGKGRSRHVPRTSPLKIRIERAKRERRKNDSVFPYTLRFLDAAGQPTKLRLKLQRRESVDEILKALRSGVTLDVDDRRDGTA